MNLDLSPQPLPLAYDADGNVRVGGTRVTLNSIINAFKQGETPEELASDFDTVGIANVYATIAYYLSHQAEVDAFLDEQRLEGEAVRQRIEALQGTEGWYERLLQRTAE